MNDDGRSVEEYKASLGGNFLQPENLLVDGTWVTAVVTVEEVYKPKTLKGADKKVIEQPAFKIQGRDKKVLLNKTNLFLMVAAMGTERTSQWIGRKVELYPVEGKWFGYDHTTGFRIRVPVATPMRPGIQRQMGTELTGQRLKNAPPPAEPENVAPSDEEPEFVNAPDQEIEFGEGDHPDDPQ